MKGVLFVFLTFGLQCTTGKISMAQRCPETKAAWDHRSSIFTCKNKDTKYHCVMTSTLKLVEACITPLNISENGGNGNGCPTVYLFESKAYWIFPFTPCSAQNVECPQKGNGYYSTDQLFKYPACFLNISERTSEGKVAQQTAKPTSTYRVSHSCEHRDECRYDVIYLPHICIAILVLVALVFIGIFRLNILVPVRFKEVMPKKIRKSDSQCRISSTGDLNDHVTIKLTHDNG